VRRVLGLIDLRRNVQQRLRGNAPAIQANSARVLFNIDQSDLKAEIGTEEGSGVTTRAAANHCNFYVLVRHVSLPNSVFVLRSTYETLKL
jgi:hypothetical protein